MSKQNKVLPILLSVGPDLLYIILNETLKLQQNPSAHAAWVKSLTQAAWAEPFSLCRWIWLQFRIFILYSIEMIWSIREENR